MKGLSIRRLSLLPLLALLFLLLVAGTLAVLSRVLPLFPPPPQEHERPVARSVFSTAGWPTVAPALLSMPTPAATPAPAATPTPPAYTVLGWSFVPARDVAHLAPGTDGALPVGDSPVPTALDDALAIVFDAPVAVEWVAEHWNISPNTTGHLVAVDARTVAFVPTEPWRVRTRYAAHVLDAIGKSYDSFETPAWMVSTPVSGTTVEPDTTIYLYFHYPVDRAALLAALRVEPAADYRAEWQGQTLALRPAATTWTLDTVYTVTLDAVPPDWPAGESLLLSFTTRSGVLGLQGVPAPCGPLVLNLDRPVDPATLSAAWRITPTISGALSAEGTQLRFLPTVGWGESTTYRVSLDAPLAAADGTLLVQRQHQWSFTIGAYWHPDFGYGPNVQVLDAVGPRILQYYRDYGGSGGCVDFRLYQASTDWLLGAYSSSFKEEAPLPDLSGLPLVRAWIEQVDEEIRLPADIPPGLYVLSSGDPAKRYDGLLVALTHYTLVLKDAGVGTGSTATHQVTGYASAISSAEPRAGMHVRLYDRSARFYGEGTTDEQGRLETAVPGDTDPLLAIGEVDGELTLCGFGPEWQAGAGYWDWWGWQPQGPAGRRFRVYAYTDRPIYRPGQAVYFKAVVRADDDALYSVLATGTPVTVRLRDARDNVVNTQVLPTGGFGTVYTQFLLAEGCTLGTYNVEVVVGEEVTRQQFKVEEYRKPDYEVIVTADRARFLEGDTIVVTVTARYYLGQPLIGMPVSVQAYRKGYDYWEYTEYWEATGRKVTGKTDVEGRAYFRLSGVQVYDNAGTISLEATVDDGSGQAVAGHAAVQVFRQRYSTRLSLERRAFRPGGEIPVSLQIWDDYLDAPVSGAQVKVGLYRWGGTSYAWDRPVVETQATSGADGRVYTALQADVQGWYRLGVSGYGDAESWVWIYDAASALPWENQDGGLGISADKDAYRVGEVAQLLVRTPVSGPAMLTLERGRVRRMVPVYLTSPVTTISLTVEADFAPNIFATVQLYRPTDPETWGSYFTRPDAEFLMASTSIVVPVPERRLQVTIVPERATYAPREQAVVTLQVTDASGNPVRAELSLAVVDEAIFALSRDLAVHPFDAFYGWRANLVRTYHSLEPVRYIGGAEGGSGGGDGFGQANPRRYFPDTAYWNPLIVTDEAGRAVVTIPLPDNLTRWRLVARAVTMETWAGEGTAALTVTQELVVRPQLPRFLVQGDTLTLTAQVYNYGENSVTVLAGLDAVGLNIAAPYTHSLSLPPGGMAAVGWKVAAAALGPATITAYAEGSGVGDGVQYAIPVVPFAVPDVQSWSGEYIGERIERVSLPDSYIREVTQIEVRLAPTVVPVLLDGLEYLIGYPFG